MNFKGLALEPLQRQSIETGACRPDFFQSGVNRGPICTNWSKLAAFQVNCNSHPGKESRNSEDL